MELVVNVVVDTGYNGTLTLRTAVVTALGLVRQSTGRAKLADGSLRSFGVFAVEAEWEGAWRPVLASALGREALLGVQILVGHEVRIAVANGGAVEITPLS